MGILTGQAGVVLEFAVLAQILKVQHLLVGFTGTTEFFERCLGQLVGQRRCQAESIDHRRDELGSGGDAAAWNVAMIGQ